MQIRLFQNEDSSAVISLWQTVLPDSAPHNDPETVIQKKTSAKQDLFYVASIDSAVVGTVMGGYDGHRGWIYSLAVDPGNQRKGIGAALVAHLENELVSRGCLKINLQVRASNEEVIAFYEKSGYAVEQRVSMGKKVY